MSSQHASGAVESVDTRSDQSTAVARTLLKSRQAIANKLASAQALSCDGGPEHLLVLAHGLSGTSEDCKTSNLMPLHSRPKTEDTREMLQFLMQAGGLLQK